MINFSKIIIVLFLALIFFASPVFAYYNPGKAAGFVNDYAGILTAEQKAALEQKLVDFEKESSNEIAVVAIPSFEEDTIENFAVRLFEDWKIGKKDKDNGILILVAMAERQIRIEVGYGLEGALTDAQSNWIITNQMRPAFREGKYYEGINMAVDKIIGATKGEYVPSEQLQSGSNKKENFDWIFAFYFGIFIFVWLASILARSKSWWGGGAVGGIIGVIIGIFKGFIFFGLIAFAILLPLGLLFDFIVSKKYQTAKKVGGRMPWWIGGSGGFGGGHGGGGGFGGFGGGGSGGGGSSGGW